MSAESAADPGERNARRIETFYAALDRRDPDAMLACYAPDVRFSDPVFPDLDAAGVAAMWRMLCSRGKDLRVVASAVTADATVGAAHWDATYTYSATGNRVENRIDALFNFRDGLIVRHRDHFDLYRWARQALGAKGLLLGWLPPVQNAIRTQAAAALAAWRAKNEPPRGNLR